jgi:hypothetical protein
MAFTLIAHAAAGSTNITNVTTPAIDTTGADLIVIAYCASAINVDPTDSKSNTLTGLTASSFSGVVVRLYYIPTPTVGTNHTFSIADAASPGPTLCVTAWSGSAISPFDQQNSGNSSGTTVQTGSLTPSFNNELIIAATAHETGFAVSSIDSSFTISDDIVGVGGQHDGGTQAYFVQNVAGAVNPTFSGDGNNRIWAASIASFKAGAGAGGTGGAAASPFFRIRKKNYPGGGWGEYH